MPDAIMRIGDVDLTDRDAYQWTQADDGEGWEESTAPVRFAPTVDTMIVSRSNKINDILTFFVVCEGEDADAAEANYQALRDEVEAAKLYWTTRGQQGAMKTVVKALEGQTTPLVWTIKTYRLHRVNHAWGSLGLVPCQLVLTVVEGLVPLQARLGFLRTQVVLPDLIVALEGIGTTLGPLAVSVAQPDLIIDVGSPEGTAVLGPLAVEVVQNELAISAPLPGLLARYRVEGLGLSDGTDIVTWTDEGPFGKDLTGPSGHRPVSHTGGPNGKRYATFNGSAIASSVATDVAPTGTAERIVFMVFRCHNRTPVSGSLVCYGPNGAAAQLWAPALEGGSDNILAYFWGSNTSLVSVGDISNWHIVALQQTAAGHPKWWVDGVDQGEETLISPNTGTGTVFSIGGNAQAGGTGEFVGDFLQVDVYSARTDLEIAGIFADLATEYAL